MPEEDRSMEVKEVIGNRRSIRFYLPHRPVEKEKIEKMLEAARRASCVGNVNNTRAVVIWKEKASAALMKVITPPLGYQQMQTAPCFILWYHDKAAYEVNKWIQDLHDLAAQRRVGVTREEADQQIEQFLRPAFSAVWQQMAEAPLAYIDVGQAIAQATLVAFDEGLGTCCMSSPRLEQVGKLLNLPDTAVPACLMSVGYPAESWEAGGQTGRAPFEELFWEGQYGKPFKLDRKVEEELKRQKMIQAPAPLPWRDAEMEYLKRALELETQIVSPPSQ
jgi:nitroreductase